MKAFRREVLVVLVVATTIFLLAQAMVHSAQMEGSSMEPNLHNGQVLLINKIVYNSHEPERGDIIVFPYPERPGEEFIKRIIGLPGEIVEIEDDIIYVHQPDGSVFALDELGYMLDELGYINIQPMNPFLGDIIPEDNYFVLGDNRNNSTDSRAGWTVPLESIIGKAWFLNWPPSEWGLAPNYSPILTTSEITIDKTEQ